MMAEGRQRHEWGVAANIMCVIASAAPFGSGKRFTPADFNPFARPQEAIDGSIHDLKVMLNADHGKPKIGISRPGSRDQGPGQGKGARAE